jgi:hypothetical protein
VGKAFGLNVAVTLQAFFTFLVGVSLAFSASWKLSFVILASLPLLIITGIIQNKAFTGK